MLEIVVCDDDIADLERAVNMLHKIFTSQKIAYHIEQFASANQMLEKWIKMTAYQQAGQWNNMNINTDRHLQKQQKPLILHGKRVNQYRLVHWMVLQGSRRKVAGSQ